MGFENFRVGHAGAAWSHGRNKRADDTSAADPSCAMGAFYTAPTLGSSYDALNPLAITWQPSLACLQPAPTLVDIYLYAPGTASSRLHLWQNVPYAPGNYSATLLPRWWNATSSASLQLNVVAAGTAPFLRTIPAGPVFTATYTAPSSGTPASADTALSSGDSGITAVTAPSSAISSRHLSRGKTAAAVLLPLLFCLLLGLAYLKISRARGAAKRSAWSEKLDKRMSTISVDWKSITPGGAKEAVRQSIAHGPSMDERRSQAFSFGAIRPSSTVAVEEYNEKEPEPRTSLGSGVGVGVGARRPRTHASPPERGSRAVSFADAAHPRPSFSSTRNSRSSRAFHTASTYGDYEQDEAAPPVPALPSPSRMSAYGGEAGQRQSAWSSGERVEGVDGGYGARSVSPTGRVHTINYPTPSSPSPPYSSNTSSPSTGSSTPAAGVVSPRQTAGPLTLTPEDIRRRMTGLGGSGYAGGFGATVQAGAGRRSEEGGQRQSVDEVFGALSLMRTGTISRSPSHTTGAHNTFPDSAHPAEEDDAGDYLFAPAMPETVFAYPGTPGPMTPAFSSVGSASPLGTANNASTSPFAMPMSAATMSPDDMLRAYAATHAASTGSSHMSMNAGQYADMAPPTPTYNGNGMRVLYAQPGEDAAQEAGMIRAGPGATFAR